MSGSAAPKFYPQFPATPIHRGVSTRVRGGVLTSFTPKTSILPSVQTSFTPRPGSPLVLTSFGVVSLSYAGTETASVLTSFIPPPDSPTALTSFGTFTMSYAGTETASVLTSFTYPAESPTALTSFTPPAELPTVLTSFAAQTYLAGSPGSPVPNPRCFRGSAGTSPVGVYKAGTAPPVVPVLVVGQAIAGSPVPGIYAAGTAPPNPPPATVIGLYTLAGAQDIGVYSAGTPVPIQIGSYSLTDGGTTISLGMRSSFALMAAPAPLTGFTGLETAKTSFASQAYFAGTCINGGGSLLTAPAIRIFTATVGGKDESRFGLARFGKAVFA